jgi:hypothetical protein
MALCPPFSNYYVGYRAYSPSYYQITENSVRCPDRPFLISEEYSGNMIQKTKVEKKQTFNETFAEENWMRRL